MTDYDYSISKRYNKTYGVDTILDNISFHVNRGDRIGIVGANGAGKTTLLNILSGELTADSGQFFVSQDATIGYLKQKNHFDSEATVIEEVEKILSRLKTWRRNLRTFL